jgi:hypothetical protein
MAIMYGTRYANANGEEIAVVPGSLVKKPESATVFVINYKMERQPVTLAGFKKYYADNASGNIWSKVVTIPAVQLANYPEGTEISDNTPPADIVGTGTANFKSGTLKYAAIGAAVIAGGFLLWKYRGKY